MPVRVISKSNLVGTSRHVRNETYETYRSLLASDDVGVTVTDIVLAPGVEATYGYDNHVEIAYCIEGKATLTDLATGRCEEIAPGTLWAACKGDRFLFEAEVQTRLICVFTPPSRGPRPDSPATSETRRERSRARVCQKGLARTAAASKHGTKTALSEAQVI
jgi:L-ectoine synthase